MTGRWIPPSIPGAVTDERLETAVLKIWSVDRKSPTLPGLRSPDVSTIAEAESRRFIEAVSDENGQRPCDDGFGVALFSIIAARVHQLSQTQPKQHKLTELEDYLRDSLAGVVDELRAQLSEDEYFGRLGRVTHKLTDMQRAIEACDRTTPPAAKLAKRYATECVVALQELASVETATRFVAAACVAGGASFPELDGPTQARVSQTAASLKREALRKR